MDKKNQQLHTNVDKKKEATKIPKATATTKQTAAKQPRKRKAAAKKPLTLRQKMAKPGALRSTVLLLGGILVACLYGLFVAIDMSGILASSSGVIFMFFLFIGFNSLLIYIGYVMGKRKKARRKRKQAS